MDTPPPILAYATPDTGVRFESDRIILPQPPPGWEIVLLCVAMLACLFGAGVGLLLSLHYLGAHWQGERVYFTIPFTMLAIVAAMKLSSLILAVSDEATPILFCIDGH